jgi:hypothetical protein
MQCYHIFYEILFGIQNHTKIAKINIKTAKNSNIDHGNVAIRLNGSVVTSSDFCFQYFMSRKSPEDGHMWRPKHVVM